MHIALAYEGFQRTKGCIVIIGVIEGLGKVMEGQEMVMGGQEIVMEVRGHGRS